MKIHLTFQGAAGTVTGSRYHLARGKAQLLVDAGLFQGLKRLRERNWTAPAFPPRSLDGVVLTHCHLDHCGWLPRLVSLGFRGTIWATEATIELAEIILADAAHLQEEDARYANRKGHSRHRPALPLFTAKDAAAAVRRMRPVEFDKWTELGHGFRAQWLNSGHILGAASVELRADLGHREIGVMFSGDKKVSPSGIGFMFSRRLISFALSQPHWDPSRNSRSVRPDRHATEHRSYAR